VTSKLNPKALDALKTLGASTAIGAATLTATNALEDQLGIRGGRNWGFPYTTMHGAAGGLGAGAGYLGAKSLGAGPVGKAVGSFLGWGLGASPVGYKLKAKFKEKIACTMIKEAYDQGYTSVLEKLAEAAPFDRDFQVKSIRSYGDSMQSAGNTVGNTLIGGGLLGGGLAALKKKPGLALALAGAGGLTGLMSRTSGSGYKDVSNLIADEVSGKKLTPDQLFTMKMKNPSGSLWKTVHPAYRPKNLRERYMSTEKLGGVGWDLNTYTMSPEEVMRAKQGLRGSTSLGDFDDVNEATGRNRFKDTNYKLNSRISIDSPELESYTYDDAYGDNTTGSILDKVKAQKALDAYSAKADEYLKWGGTEVPTVTPQDLAANQQEARSRALVGTGAGGLAGAGLGALAGVLSKGKFKTGTSSLFGGGVGALTGAMAGASTVAPPKQTIRPRLSDEEMGNVRSGVSAFKNRMSGAIKDPTVKSIGLEWE